MLSKCKMDLRRYQQLLTWSQKGTKVSQGFRQKQSLRNRNEQIRKNVVGVADFGGGIGERECYLLDNPDVPTSAEALGVANAASRFGTTPTFWNSLFGGMKAIPQSLLADRGKMQGFALFSMPIIRIVDALVGATNAMRVDAWPKGGGGPPVTIRVAHNDLEDCVGQATAAFGLELLRETGTATIEPGVWFPAELQKLARTNILEKAREGAFVWDGFV